MKLSITVACPRCAGRIEVRVRIVGEDRSATEAVLEIEPEPIVESLARHRCEAPRRPRSLRSVFSRRPFEPERPRVDER